MDRGAWWATVHGVEKSQTRLSRQAQHRTAQCIYRLSLVAWTVENLPAVWETQVSSLGWEDPLKKRMAIHSSILAWRNPQTEEPGGTVLGVTKSWT